MQSFVTSVLSVWEPKKKRTNCPSWTATLTTWASSLSLACVWLQSVEIVSVCTANQGACLVFVWVFLPPSMSGIAFWFVTMFCLFVRPYVCLLFSFKPQCIHHHLHVNLRCAGVNGMKCPHASLNVAYCDPQRFWSYFTKEFLLVIYCGLVLRVFCRAKLRIKDFSLLAFTAPEI